MDRPETAQVVSAAGASRPGAGRGPEIPPAGGPIGGSAQAAFQASVVVLSSGASAIYPMYEALNVTQEGATLRGGLLLEVNEEVALELRLPDRTALLAGARVVEILLGSPPAMKVIWTGVDDADRHHLRR